MRGGVTILLVATTTLLFVYCPVQGLAQQHIFDADPERFEHLSDSQFEQLLDELLSLKSTQPSWQDVLNMAMGLEWTDHHWIRSVLQPSLPKDRTRLLTHSYADPVTAALIQWLLPAYKAKTRKPTFAMLSSGWRWHQAGNNHLGAEFRNRLQFSRANYQMGLASAQGIHHQDPRWRKMQAVSFFQKIGWSVKSSDFALWMGNLQYSFGSGLIGNINRRVRMHIHANTLSSRYRISGWLNPYTEQSLQGFGLHWQNQKHSIHALYGVNRFKQAARQSHETATELTKSSFWQDPSMKVGSAIGQFIGSWHFQADSQQQFSAQFAYYLLEGKAYAGQKLRNRLDTELGWVYTSQNDETRTAVYLGRYDLAWQVLSSLDHRVGDYALRFSAAYVQQNTSDLFRRMPFIVGSSGQNTWLSLHLKRYQGRRIAHRLMFAYVRSPTEAQNAQITLPQGRWYASFAYPFQGLPSRRKVQLLMQARWQEEASSAQNAQLSLQLLYQAKLSNRLNWTSRVGLLNRQATQLNRFYDGSLFNDHRLMLKQGSVQLEARYQSMLVDPDHPMQRLDSWSASHLIRDTLVRNDSNQAFQFRMMYAFKKMFEASIAFTQLRRSSYRLLEHQGLRFWTKNRSWLNLQLRYSFSNN